MASLQIDHAAAEAAIARLVDVARSDTGQARRVANFLLAWWNGPELGDFPVADVFGLDAALGRDIATLLGFLAEHPGAIYPDAFGRRDDMVMLVARWRPDMIASSDEA